MFITINRMNDGKELEFFKFFKIGYGNINESGLWLLAYIGIRNISIGLTFNWTKPIEVEVNNNEIN